MYIDLLQLLQCPLCHGGLAWSVNKKMGKILFLEKRSVIFVIQFIESRRVSLTF